MRYKKISLVVFLALGVFIYLTFPSTCQAARKRIRKPKKSTTIYVSQGVRVFVRFRPDRLGLLLTFSHFDNLQSGSYQLVYEANGVGQGAGGSIILGDNSTKELLFATCSGGICTFHENITNARLSITSVLKNGTTVLKPFRIKV